MAVNLEATEAYANTLAPEYRHSLLVLDKSCMRPSWQQMTCMADNFVTTMLCQKTPSHGSLTFLIGPIVNSDIAHALLACA